MGLAERRAIERFKNDEYPSWQRRIEQAAGFEVPIEVAWEELGVADYADRYGEYFPKVYFQPLVDALTEITVDELGRTAARDGLARIVVKNSGQHSSASGFTFRDGVLTIDHQPHYNVDYGEERAKGLQRILESGL